MRVYLITNTDGKFKIGYSRRNVKKRMAELQTASPIKLKIVHQFETDYPVILEKTLHRLNLTAEDVDNFLHECSKVERNLTFLKENRI